MDIDLRKKELATKWEQLKNEAATSTSQINQLVNSCGELLQSVVHSEDRAEFYKRYPSVVCDLDLCLQKLLQFNCDMATFEITGTGIENPMPRPCRAIEEEDCIVDKINVADEVRTVDASQVVSCLKSSRDSTKSLAYTENASDDEHLPSKYGDSNRLPFSTGLSVLNSLEKDKPKIQDHHPTSGINISKASVFKVTSELKREQILCSVKRPVKINDVCEVTISHIISPDEFYVNIVCEENSSYDNFHTELNEFYSKKKLTFNDKTHAKRYISNYCCCYQPGIEWCRGQILDWCSVDNLIEVQLIDYGYVCNVPLAMVQPLAQVFFLPRLFAMRCHLAFLTPPEQHESWPLECTKLFKYYIPANKKCKVTNLDTPNLYTIIKAEDDKVPLLYESKKAHQSSVPVVILKRDDKDTWSVNDKLVELGYASLSEVDKASNIQGRNENQTVCKKSLKTQDVWEVSSCTEASNTSARHQILPHTDYISNDRENLVLKTSATDMENSQLERWNPMQDDFLHPSGSSENALVAVSGYDQKDASRMCKFYARHGHCFKGLNCRKEHSLLYADGVTTDKELIYTNTYSDLCMPAEGTMVSLKVVHVPENQKHFYCVLQKNLLLDPCEETITSLMKYMNESNQVRSYKHLSLPPAPGQLVLAFCAVDQMWMRARVVEEPNDEEDTVKVIFVDNCRTEIVADSYIRAMKPYLLHLPFQAIECYLANVEITPRNSRAFATYFDVLYRTKVLRAKVITSIQLTQVMHILLHNEYGKDVGTLLVKGGFGKSKDHINKKLNIIPR